MVAAGRDPGPACPACSRRGPGCTGRAPRHHRGCPACARPRRPRSYAMASNTPARRVRGSERLTSRRPTLLAAAAWIAMSGAAPRRRRRRGRDRRGRCALRTARRGRSRWNRRSERERTSPSRPIAACAGRASGRPEALSRLAARAELPRPLRSRLRRRGRGILLTRRSSGQAAVARLEKSVAGRSPADRIVALRGTGLARPRPTTGRRPRLGQWALARGSFAAGRSGVWPDACATSRRR